MESEDQQQIIIVKKSGGHEGHHGGAWKVAYADFVTAMMAFFLVMWLVNQDQIIKDNVAGYFNDPVNWGKKAGSSVLPGGASILESQIAPPPKRTDSENSRDNLQKTGGKLLNALEGIPGFETVKDHIKIEMTSEGLRIQLIEASGTMDDSSYFFDLGSSRLSSKGTMILSVIASELGNLHNNIVIEGHTDSRKYSMDKKYSNWELSADRANSARKLMEEKGIKTGQIFEIRGYADNSPMIEDNPLDARNRRIAIVVMTEDPKKESDEATPITDENPISQIIPVKHERIN